jgi:hypothetical protein
MQTSERYDFILYKHVWEIIIFVALLFFKRFINTYSISVWWMSFM